MRKEKNEDGSYWAFALINGRLAEFNFEINKGKFYMGMGHCYVKRREYKTKYEQRMIDKDNEKYRFTYVNKKYRRVGEKKIIPTKCFRISKKEKMITLEDLLKTTKTS